jgi:hypothetical protein
MKMINKNNILAISAIGYIGVCNPAWGDGFSDIDMSFSGMIRLETAIKTVDDENPNNQRGNLFNGVEVERNGGLPVLGLQLPALLSDTTTRNGVPADNDFNQVQIRTENTLQLRFTDKFSATVKVRGIFDAAEYDEFDPSSVNSMRGGHLYSGAPNYFEHDDFDDGGSFHPLEVAGDNYMVDFPSLYVDYQDGPILVRAGNQQVAWGQALFFRVMDVANGLDLRRHLILDFASEEYADERISAPGIRASYQFESGWELDTFVQMFIPSVLPNPETPYNLIPSQFTVHERYENYDEELNSGFRLKGNFGDLGLQFMYTSRYNPDGTFRWTKSNVNRDIPTIPGSGAILAETPLERDPTGIWSAEEWFTYAGMVRLDGIEALNSQIADFPAEQLLGGTNAANYEQASNELDFFFQVAGPLRGHIERTFHREDVFGAGFSYVFSGDPGSWTDQLIMNFEVSYTPDKTFTATSLGKDYLVEDEYTSALVLEKYQRFSSSFPATYLVFQWMHRSETDLFGRHLSGMGGTVDNAPTGVNGGWNGLVLAAQQPFPGLVWRVDASVLYDTRGGLLFQPAVKWKPSGNWNVEFYYNYLDGSLGGDENTNIFESIEFAEELGIRVAYQY